MGSGTVIGNLTRGLQDRSPFEWLLITPTFALPVSALLVFTVGGALDAQALGLLEVEWTKDDRRLDRTHYFYFDFWLTWGLLTAPGAVNLAVVRWLGHELTYVRIAAGLATVLALLRTFVVPVAAVLWLTGEVISDAGTLLRIPVSESRTSADPSPTFATWNLLLTAWMGGLGMWLLTFALWRVYDPFMERFFPGMAPPRDESQGEPGRWGGFFRRR